MRRFATTSMAKPQTCFYKLLNVSASADADEIKKSYYVLAKKYHPDALSSAIKDNQTEFEKAKEHFKKITEAYAILSDKVMRTRYDNLLFGESRSFTEDEQAYEYWSKKEPEKSRRVMEEYEEMQERVREKLKTYKDYDDFLKNFERHRFKHEHRAHLLREDGWKELNDKHGPPSDFDLHASK